MKLFKRFITIAVCATLATLPLSGCNLLFGSRCQHSGTDSGYDEQSHYRICSECGGKYDVKTHRMYMAADETQHFMKCYYCEYANSYQSHDMGDWENVYGSGVRRCLTEDCQYKVTCNHSDTVAYVVSDDGHYRACENCKVNITDKTAHDFKTYTDLTETTHSLSCECGKVSSEAIAHDFKYKHNDDSHWQTCVCGFETEKEACTYGSYAQNTNAHYKVCSVCEGIGMMKTHSHELTEDRKRVCPECLHEEEPYALLLGTWKYSISGQAYRLTLNANWSYTLVFYEGIFSSGSIIGSGDYSVRYYVGLDGKISGTISLLSKTGYNGSSIEYEFRKGVTNQFRDRDNRLYTKQ